MKRLKSELKSSASKSMRERSSATADCSAHSPLVQRSSLRRDQRCKKVSRSASEGAAASCVGPTGFCLAIISRCFSSKQARPRRPSLVARVEVALAWTLPCGKAQRGRSLGGERVGQLGGTTLSPLFCQSPRGAWHVGVLGRGTASRQSLNLRGVHCVPSYFPVRTPRARDAASSMQCVQHRRLGGQLAAGCSRSQSLLADLGLRRGHHYFISAPSTRVQ